jgi:FtsH-binding integral membrane protein
VLISAAWMLYDVQRIVRGGETNYVSASLSVYLNLYNMFVSLLNLLMALTGQRD